MKFFRERFKVRKVTGWYWLLLGVWLLWLTWRLRQVLLLLLAAYLLMVLLQKPSAWVAKFTHLPRPAAVTVTYVTFGLLFLAAAAWLVPPILAQATTLLDNLNLDKLPAGLADDLRLSQDCLERWQVLLPNFAAAWTALLWLIGGNLSAFGALFALVVISIYLSLERDNLYKRSYWFTSDENLVARIQKFFLVVENHLGQWLSGQLVLAVVMGALLSGSLVLLDSRYALLLGVMTGLLQILLQVGLILSLLIGTVVFFIFDGWLVALIALVTYVVFWRLVDLFLLPRLFGESGTINPLASLILLLVGGELFGWRGAFLILPLYVIGREFYGFWWQDTVRARFGRRRK